MPGTRGARWAPIALAVIAALGLAGCAAGREGTLSPDSVTCHAAQSLFGERDAESNDIMLERLESGIPKELRATVESLRDHPASADEWKSYDASLAKVQQWAVSACGVTVTLPVESAGSKPRLEDHLTSVSRDGDAISVIVSGATGLDAAVQLCEQALEKHGEAGHPMSLRVRDSFGIPLAALDDDGECVIDPEFAP